MKFIKGMLSTITISFLIAAVVVGSIEIIKDGISIISGKQKTEIHKCEVTMFKDEFGFKLNIVEDPDEKP